MLVDTHIHLYLEQFSDDLDEVILRALDAGVQILVLPAINIPTIEQALNLCHKYEGVYAMTALHPSDVKDATESDMQVIADYCSDPHIVAVGETGLDYYWDQSFNDKQKKFLKYHLEIAEEADLPVVFHNRDASEDLVKELRLYKESSVNPEKIRGIFHCFGGPIELASEILELGFHVGLGGTLTFKNGGVPDTIEGIPLDRIVLETDAPFLAPVPFRGKRNEPAHVRLVAQKLADLRNMSVEEIGRVTTANALALFGLDPAKTLRAQKDLQ